MISISMASTSFIKEEARSLPLTVKMMYFTDLTFAMPVTQAGRKPATFDIKSANLPLMALILKSLDLAQLSAQWTERFSDTPDFFDNDPLVIDFSLLAHEITPVDLPALMRLLRQYRLLPVAVRGGNEQQMADAIGAGLFPAPDLVSVPGIEQRTETLVQEVVREVVREVEVPVSPAPSAAAMVIDKPLRSGQQVYAKGRDLVLMSMVNPGAEVIADGHIHVYAPLRGKAIAGARGNSDARIFSLCLEAELISIAGVYRTSETPLPAEVRSKPTQVRLEGGSENGKLIMEALRS
jgi:septum site-determining protein MinC